MRELYHTSRVIKYAVAALAFFAFQTGCIKRTSVGPPEVRSALLQVTITEINYHPIDDRGNSADQFEFVEIKDTSSTEVDLTDVQFNDGIDYDFPANTILKPDSFIVLASNAGEFKNRYGFDPFGIFAGKLSNGGEKLSMEDKRANKKFLSLTYGTSGAWPKSADGDGYSLVPKNTGETGDANSAAYWRASFRKGGSPGKDDPGVVYINEVLAHTDPPDTDAIELYNPNNSAVDIGNWFLTDSRVDPEKFRIPAGTAIPPGGYIVFTANSFNADTTSKKSFAFSEHGDQAYLFSDSMGILGDGYCTGYTFTENENGVSLGRYVNSRGEEDFVALSAKTLGAANAPPRVGPLVISEIMYHPKNNIDEYIEMINISGSELPLYDPKFPKNTWRINGVDFAFPDTISLKNDERVLIVTYQTTESQFRTTYNVPSSVKIFLMAKNISNAGDSLVLLKPSEPYIDTIGQTINPYIPVERVNFTDAASWHSDADGTGQSLQRKNLDEFANDPMNWNAGSATPGK